MAQSPILLARINEKKAELESLKQLRDLSAGLAGQMQMLEEKLSTLSDGAEGMDYGLGFGTILITIYLAVATVMGNWHNVLRAISMASSEFVRPARESLNKTCLVKIPKPKEGEENTEDNLQKKAESELQLPQTLVRIPTEHAPMLQQPSAGGGGNADS